jgi:hypothetical protein
VDPALTTVTIPGGTPSVIPVNVSRYTGRPPTVICGDEDPGSVDTTDVHGLEPGLAG